MANDEINFPRKREEIEKAPSKPPHETINSAGNIDGKKGKIGKGLFLCGVGDTLKEAITACSRKGPLDQPDVVRLEDHANLKDHHERLRKYYEDIERDNSVDRQSASRNVDIGDETDASNTSYLNEIVNELPSATFDSSHYSANLHNLARGNSCDGGPSTKLEESTQQGHQCSPTKIMSGPSYSSDCDPGINPSSKQHKQDELYGTYKNYRVDDEFVSHVVDELAVTLLPHFRSAATDNKHKHPIGVYSEPVAWNVHVRGKSYMRDKQKVRSAESLFAIIGADKFVVSRGVKSELGDRYHLSKRKKSFVNRLRHSCEKNCVTCPFLLVINFVLPWGNFLMYMYRPDGDQGGPFNDSRRNEAAEKSWKDFLTGSEEYRNERLKLIPGLIAGPYLVKKNGRIEACDYWPKAPDLLLWVN